VKVVDHEGGGLSPSVIIPVDLPFPRPDLLPTPQYVDTLVTRRYTAMYMLVLLDMFGSLAMIDDGQGPDQCVGRECQLTDW